MGRLGQAIAEYGGFRPQGFEILAAFDANEAMVGTLVGGVAVHFMDELESFIQTRSVDIGIGAAPAAHAQAVVDRLVEAGVQAILNYAPVTARVPRDVTIRRIDPALEMQSMTFYIKKGEAAGK